MGWSARRVMADKSDTASGIVFRLGAPAFAARRPLVVSRPGPTPATGRRPDVRLLERRLDRLHGLRGAPGRGAKLVARSGYATGVRVLERDLRPCRPVLHRRPATDRGRVGQRA